MPHAVIAGGVAGVISGVISGTIEGIKSGSVMTGIKTGVITGVTNAVGVGVAATGVGAGLSGAAAAYTNVIMQGVVNGEVDIFKALLSGVPPGIGGMVNTGLKGASLGLYNGLLLPPFGMVLDFIPSPSPCN